MKKIYINPETKIVKIQTANANMIAISMYGKDAENPGMSRRGNSVWDDDEDEYGDY